jgi:hypothetical protein
MRLTRGFSKVVLTAALISGAVTLSFCQQTASSATLSPATPEVAVGAQYDTTHVYVTPEDFDRFVASLLGTFGGTASKQVVTTVTPTPSTTISQLVLTPVGTLSVFGYKTPVPVPFGVERTGYLVNEMDAAIRLARATGADVVVAPFDDPIGSDAVIQFPGGIDTQLYVHTKRSSYKPLETIPENRVYVSPDRADAFIRSFLAFSHGKVVIDDPYASATDVGRPNDTFRRVRIESTFGKMTVLVTDGHLPYPYGRELVGYEVVDLADTLIKAKNAGVDVLVAPYESDQRRAAIVQFPGGYIAEIHAALKK